MRIGINARQMLGKKDGIGYYTYHLIRNLTRIDKGNEYVIFSPKCPSLNLENKNFKNSSIKFPITSKFLRGFWEHFLLPLEYTYKKIDLLHCLAHTFPLVFKGRRVLTIHDIAFLVHPRIIPKPLYFYYLTFISSAVSSADKIIAISHHTKADLIKLLRVPSSKIKVIYQGVSSIFQPLKPKGNFQRVKTKYNIRGRFILYLGSLVKRKNLKRLIRAYYVLKKTKKIEQQLLIVGARGYPFSPDIFSLVKELGLGQEVIFTGYVPERDVSIFYNTADLLVYPSLYEGFGLPVLEAMACGCPVITSRNSSLLEIAGEAAILINPYNIDEIAYWMYQLLIDNRLGKDLIQKGFQRARQFRWENTAQDTLGVYEEVLSSVS